MEYSIGDLADRLSILALKAMRLPPNEEIQRELSEVDEAVRHSDIQWDDYGMLLDVNGKIFDLESDLRQGKLQNPQTEAEFAEIGRRALAIRDLNRERIRIKNTINARLGEGFQELKGNHCSEIATPPA